MIFGASVGYAAAAVGAAARQATLIDPFPARGTKLIVYSI